MDYVTYEATAERGAKFWVVTIKGLPEQMFNKTQGRTWQEASTMARDLVAMMLEIDHDSFGMHIVPADQDAAQALDLLNAARRTTEKAKRAEAEALEAAAKTLTGHGFSVRDAGAALGMSYQRVSQLAPQQAPQSKHTAAPPRPTAKKATTSSRQSTPGKRKQSA